MTSRAFSFVIAICVVGAAAGCRKSEPSGASVTPGASNASSQSAAPPPASASPVELKLKMPVGARFTQRLDLTQSSQGHLPGKATPTKQGVMLGQEFDVRVLGAREGGGCEVELQFGDCDLSVTMNEREVMAFDSRGESAGEAENPVAKSFRGMVGAQIKLQLDRSNRVEKVEGVPELTRRMAGGAARVQRGFLAGMWTEDYFKQFGDFGSGLPDQPVKMGDQWPVKKEIVMGPLGSATLDLTYTFGAWEPRAQTQCARLDFTGTVSGHSAGPAEPMRPTTTVRDGQVQGRAWFDPERGQFLEIESTQTMTVLMTMAALPMPGAPGTPAAGGVTVTNVVTQKLRKTLLPDERK